MLGFESLKPKTSIPVIFETVKTVQPTHHCPKSEVVLVGYTILQTEYYR